MNLKDLIKKQTIIVIIVVIVLTVGGFATTYALFFQVNTNTTNQVVTAGTLAVTYDNNNSTIIQNTGLLPVSNEEGLATTGANVSIRNTGTLPASYVLTIENDIATFNSQVGSGTLVDFSDIRIAVFKVDNLASQEILGPTLLSSLANDSINNSAKVLTTNDLFNSEEVLYNVKIWINIDADEDTVSKYVYLKLNVRSEVTESPDFRANIITVNGGASFSIPQNPSYNVTPNCTGATSNWNYAKWALEVSAVSSPTATCNYTFTTPASKVYLNNYVKSLTNADGVYQESHTLHGTNFIDYRYEGKNPNNYVRFNGELYRIIGVFGEETHGIADTDLVKIIRNDSIGGFARDKNNSNAWATSSLYTILNTYFYNRTDGTSSAYCYAYSLNIKGNCDFTGKGLTEISKSMVQSATWHLRGLDYSANTPESFYQAERSTGTVNSGATTVTANIGLLYVSDYGFSVTSASCNTGGERKNVGSYNTQECAGSSWLYGVGYEWMLTPYPSNTSGAWYIGDSGSVGIIYSDYGYAARSSLYLDSSVYKISGSGSKSDPYIIGIDAQ